LSKPQEKMRTTGFAARIAVEKGIFAKRRLDLLMRVEQGERVVAWDWMYWTRKPKPVEIEPNVHSESTDQLHIQQMDRRGSRS
jgi:hypothetical protein